MTSPDGLHYSEAHEWVRLDGTRAVIGITDYAQDALGDVVYVEVPDVGMLAMADASVAEIESTKSVSEVYCPISGKVVEVNGELEDAPEVINQDPYGRGWIFVIEVADASEVDRLMDAAQYEAFLAG